jgi:hypothetical protein
MERLEDVFAVNYQFKLYYICAKKGWLTKTFATFVEKETN